MKRKLIKQANQAYTITLPIKWIRSCGLNAGDEIEVQEKDKIITISSSGDEVTLKKVISLDTINVRYLRAIIALSYRSGYDELVLQFKKVPPLKEINQIVDSFTGLEMISQEKNTLTLKSFLKLGENEVENLIIKMFQITKLFPDSLTNLNEEKLENLGLIIPNLRKLRDHCLRTIHLNKYGMDKSHDYYGLVAVLENIGVEFFYLAESFPKKSELITNLISLFDEAYKCYLKKEFITANKFWIKVDKEIKTKINKKSLPVTIKNRDPVLIVHYYHLLKLFRRLSSRIVSISS